LYVFSGGGEGSSHSHPRIQDSAAYEGYSDHQRKAGQVGLIRLTIV